MESRINFYQKGNNAMKGLYTLSQYLHRSPVEQHLLDLVYFRVSQINGCAYCLDMHSKDLRAMGETEQRLYMLNAWRDTPVYTDRERAALAYAEAVTRITDGQVSASVYEAASAQFSDEELVDLTMAIIAINGYNRINIAFAIPGGSYVSGQHAM